MTLRGLGPYLHGERLEIRPLTILCGENGSGKSTWIEILSKLQKTAAGSEFPFTTLDDPDRRGYTTYTRNTNAVVLIPPDSQIPRAPVTEWNRQTNEYVPHWQNRAPTPEEELELRRIEDIKLIREARNAFSRSNDIIAFGPLCCVGLEITLADNWAATRNGFNPPPDSLQEEVSSNAEGFLWHGSLRSQTKVKARWAYPDTSFQIDGGENQFLDGLTDWIEIVFDDGPCIRLTAELSGRERPNDLCYELKGSASLVVGTSKGSNELQFLARYDRETLKAQSVFPGLSDEVVTAVTQNFILLFRELVQGAVEGFFHIGAIRRLQKSEETTELDDKLQRYVGKEGEHSQTVYANWASTLMRQPSEPFTGGIDNQFVDEDFDWPHRDGSPGHQKKWNAAKFLRHMQCFDHMLRIADSKFLPPLPLEDHVAALELMNHVLTRLNLFRSELWPDAQTEFGVIDASRSDMLLSLADDEVRRLNRLLIEASFNKFSPGACRHRTGYLVETFIDFWLTTLTGVKSKYGSFDGNHLGAGWIDKLRPPNGGPVHEFPSLSPRGFRGQRQSREEYKDELGGSEDATDVISCATFHGWGGWHLMSCGFHQIAPIVVQAALLRQNEILAIENPEAHLHPSLQIEVAEFLMHQANAGKVLLIETHSDLIVRRTLRAIREEQICEGSGFKQESVRIYFTHLEDGPSGSEYKFAKMEQLQINDQGLIANWPKGFMDQDIEEANRWLMAIERERSFEDDE